MIVRKRKAAACLLVFCMIFSGCKREEADGLETYIPEQAETVPDSEDTEQSEKHLSEEKISREREADGTGEREVPENPGEEKTEENPIFVDVCGAVQRPGVYELEAGGRVYQALACAGGVTEEAAEEYVNQARPAVDGEQIYVPTEEEVSQDPAAFLDGRIFPVLPEEGTGTDAGSAAKSPSVERKVNLNTASKEELKTLSGIGDTRAESIISYRETNGPFTSIEDLKKVDGIKDGVFQKIKDGITVNAGG